jgi:hypothetical protein
MIKHNLIVKLGGVIKDVCRFDYPLLLGEIFNERR